MAQAKCSICGVTLLGGLDTFGDIHDPLCRHCFLNGPSGENESIYGFFPGGDPRDFVPDPECSTPAEQKRWVDDCEEWNKGNCKYVPGSCKEEFGADGNLKRVLTTSIYGLGVYTYKE